MEGILQVSSVFDLSFQFAILHLLISACTQFHHLYFGRPLSPFPRRLLLLDLTFLLLSILDFITNTKFAERTYPHYALFSNEDTYGRIPTVTGKVAAGKA